MRATRVIVVVAAAVVGLAGCGGDGDAPESSVNTLACSQISDVEDTAYDEAAGQVRAHDYAAAAQTLSDAETEINRVADPSTSAGIRRVAGDVVDAMRQSEVSLEHNLDGYKAAVATGDAAHQGLVEFCRPFLPSIR